MAKAKMPRANLGVRMFEATWSGSVALLDTLRLKELVRETVLPRLLSATNSSGSPDQPADPVREVSGQVRKLLRSGGRPIVVGPWMSEVGFETLYWIPFLRCLLKRQGIDPEQVVSITRGGGAYWYRGIANRHMDIFDICSTDEYRSKLEKRWESQRGQKQFYLTEWDNELIDAAKTRFKLKDPVVLHPHHMNAAFRRFWIGKSGGFTVLEALDFGRFASAGDEEARLEGLPDSYIAVRFYFNDSIPQSPEAKASIQKLISRLAADHNIVLLNPGYEFDDHVDFSPEERKRIFQIGHLLTPSNNLEIQTRAIRGAKAFIGTYGGLSYVPIFYGVPSIAFYTTKENLSQMHLMIANSASRANDTPFYALNLNDADLLGSFFKN
jgi:hypothetical protein